MPGPGLDALVRATDATSPPSVREPRTLASSRLRRPSPPTLRRPRAWKRRHPGALRLYPGRSTPIALEDPPGTLEGRVLVRGRVPGRATRCPNGADQHRASRPDAWRPFTLSPLSSASPRHGLESPGTKPTDRRAWIPQVVGVSIRSSSSLPPGMATIMCREKRRTRTSRTSRRDARSRLRHHHLLGPTTLLAETVCTTRSALRAWPDERSSPGAQGAKIDRVPFVTSWMCVKQSTSGAPAD